MHERIDPYLDKNIIQLSRQGHIRRYLKVMSSIIDIADDTKILDAGCGYGYGSYLLSQKSSQVIGLDSSEDAINYAQQNYLKSNITYIRDSIESCNLNTLGDQDIIACFEVLEHVDNPNEVLKFFYNLLKKNHGYLFISTPNASNASCNNEYHHQVFKINDILLLLKNNRFEIKAMFGQYPLLGSVAQVMRKVTNYDTHTDKRSGYVPQVFDTLPLFSNIFSRIYRGRIATVTGRTLYFIAHA